MNSNRYTRIILALCTLVCSPVIAADKEKKKPVTIHTQTTTTPATAPQATPSPAPLPAVTAPASAAATAELSSTVAAALATTTSIIASESSSSTTSALSTPATTTAPSSPALTSTIASATISETILETAPTTAVDYSCVTDLPVSSITSIKRHQEQIIGLNFLEQIKDSADFRTLSHENYLEKHVTGQTLTVALSTADQQRAKFCHAANELVQKASKRADKNMIKRMARFISWADAYNIELSDADLRAMKEQTETQIKDALATLALINNKIKIKPTSPSPFDKVGRAESKRAQQQVQ